MMAWLIERALRLRLLVLCLTALLLAGGWQLVRTTPLDVFPEFAPPLVEIQTEAPGLSTDRGREPRHACRSRAPSTAPPG